MPQGLGHADEKQDYSKLKEYSQIKVGGRIHNSALQLIKQHRRSLWIMEKITVFLVKRKRQLAQHSLHKLSEV